jgi:sporulation protein YlmC with PRC-barrel domain
MLILKRARLAGAVVAIAGFPLLANAQTETQPTSPAPSAPPAATQPAPSPMPPPATRPSTEPKRPVTGPADKSAAAKTNPLIGLAVFSSDGSRLGTVQSVATEPGGKVTAIHIKTGGFLGFGGKTVAIPEGKFTRAGDNVQLGMTSEEVSKLPEIKKES